MVVWPNPSELDLGCSVGMRDGTSHDLSGYPVLTLFPFLPAHRDSGHPDFRIKGL